jgi:hypothetical protein
MLLLKNGLHSLENILQVQSKELIYVKQIPLYF